MSLVYFYLTDTPTTKILELFGKMFFEFCQESGYDKILQVLGGTTRDFLQNLDALHDHLATIYPGMRAPSFRCSEREEDGALILHYYSDRNGLEPIVIGIVKEIALKLHNSEVDVEIIKTKEDGIDHVQFAIIDKTNNEGNSNIELEEYDNSLATEHSISPNTFCIAFPFHIVFDRNMVIHQAGASLNRVIPGTTRDDCKINEMFEMVRPHMPFEFEYILSHINTVYVIRTKESVLERAILDSDRKVISSQGMRLKGQMIYVRESDCILFMCSPSVSNLDDLYRRGLYLSDIPLHDATRDLVLLSEHFEAEYKLTQKLEILTDQLQQTYRELEDEKQKTDRLVKSEQTAI